MTVSSDIQYFLGVNAPGGFFSLYYQLLPPDGELGWICDEDGTEFHKASYPLPEGLTLLRNMYFVIFAQRIYLIFFNCLQCFKSYAAAGICPVMGTARDGSR